MGTCRYECRGVCAHRRLERQTEHDVPLVHMSLGCMQEMDKMLDMCRYAETTHQT
jgi:hypothetical protein